MFTVYNTEGYSEYEIDCLNDEWNQIVEDENLDIDRDPEEYDDREKQFADEVAKRHPGE